jgi:glycosyltransferase involved in cell wall biosynthesis
MLDETNTTEFALVHGPVSHARSIELQRTAAAVLLTSARVIGGRDYSIAGKVAEYFGLRRPILGVLTDGAMRDVVEQSGLGLLADPEDTEAIATQIARIVSAPPDAQLVSPNDAFLAQFERRATAREMAMALRRAASEGYRG